MFKSIITLTLLLGSQLGAYAAGNKTATNGLGSLPQQRHVISVNQAEHIINHAVKVAADIVPENIAIVDPSGLLVAFHRMDNAYPGSIDISIKKARTTVLFNGLTTESLNAAVMPGPNSQLYGVEETNGGLVVFGGGIPLYYHGYLIGGIGVSGGTVAQDLLVANAAVDWFTNTTSSHPSSY